jgi:hypothetical protein
MATAPILEPLGDRTRITAPTRQARRLRRLVERHWFGSAATDAGKFARDVGVSELRAFVRTAVERGGAPELDKGLWVVEARMDRIIGVAREGPATDWLRLVWDDAGVIRSAYPVLR